MRSRFSAYRLGGYGNYLYNTWYQADKLGLSSDELSAITQDWSRLEILDKAQQGDQAEVEFKAYFSTDTGTEETLHERSCFIRVNGKWLYVDGKIF